MLAAPLWKDMDELRQVTVPQQNFYEQNIYPKYIFNLLLAYYASEMGVCVLVFVFVS